MTSAWAWAVIAAIGVGSPVIAWLLSRDLPAPRRRAARPGFKTVDRWLHERCQLSALERWQVEDAIVGDVRKLDDPRLREAARALAGEFSSGRLKAPRAGHAGAWMIFSVAITGLTLGITGLITGHPAAFLSLYYLAECAGGLAILLAWFLVAPARMRRNLSRLGDDQARRPDPP